MADDLGEVVALLREMRDVQRVHFEQYQKFTSHGMAQGDEAIRRQSEAMAQSATLQAAEEEFRRSQLIFQAEMLAEAARGRVFAVIASICSALLTAAAVGVVIAFASLRR